MNSKLPITINDINNVSNDIKLKLAYDIFMTFSIKKKKYFKKEIILKKEKI